MSECAFRKKNMWLQKTFKTLGKKVKVSNLHIATWARKFVLDDKTINSRQFLLATSHDYKPFEVDEKRFETYRRRFCDSAKFASIYAITSALLRGQFRRLLETLDTYVTEDNLFRRCIIRDDKNFSGDMLSGYNLAVVLSLKILPRRTLADNLPLYTKIYLAYKKIFSEKPYGFVKGTTNDKIRGWVLPKSFIFHPYQLSTAFATLFAFKVLNEQFGFEALDFTPLYELLDKYVKGLNAGLEFKPVGYFAKLPLLGYCQLIEFYQIHSTLLNFITIQLATGEEYLLPVNNYAKFSSLLNPDLILLMYILEKRNFATFTTDLDCLVTLSSEIVQEVLSEVTHEVDNLNENKKLKVGDLKHFCKRKQDWYKKRVSGFHLRHEYLWEKNWFVPRKTIHPFYELGLAVGYDLLQLFKQT